MAFKMKYKKGMGFPFKNDDEKSKTVVRRKLEKTDDNEFVNDGSVQPGVTQELHDALTEDLENKKGWEGFMNEMTEEQISDVVQSKLKSKKK